MNKSVNYVIVSTLLLATVVRFVAAAEPLPFAFRDVATEVGLRPAIEQIQGHAAGWGDVDGDGWLDLYAATFAGTGYKNNQLFRNMQGKFQLDTQPALQLPSRATGALFCDLDNDGDRDLYLSSMPSDKLNTVGCKLFRNEGAGKYTDISADNGACPTAFGGRSATTLDYDGDGKLDLLVGEDPLTGYNGSPTKAARLFRNLGSLQFADVSRAVGLPEQLPALGVAVADVNNDTWPDIFLAAAKGGNRLFVNDAAGKFREVPTAANEAETKLPKGDHTHALCGVCFGDVNRDGWLDLVLGQHTKTPWVSPAANRLYLHGGLKNGVPEYADITEAAGLPALPMKAPHVELQDFDNDGWLDLYCSYVMYAPPVAAGMPATPQPVVFRNLGQSTGVQFKTSVLSLNDFPNDSDRAIKSTGTFFKKMVSEEKCLYVAAAPTADFNNDGKLDILFCSWWPEQPSLLLQNETQGGNWLQVQVNGTGVLNRDGIGTRVKVYPAGKCGDAHALLGMQEIASGFGYASAQAPISHFGLGTHELVDLEIIWPHGKGRLEQRGVKANQRLTLAN